PGRLLRLGWLKRGPRLATGREHVVLPRPRSTDAAAGLCLPGRCDGADAGARVHGGVGGTAPGRRVAGHGGGGGGGGGDIERPYSEDLDLNYGHRRAQRRRIL